MKEKWNRVCPHSAEIHIFNEWNGKVNTWMNALIISFQGSNEHFEGVNVKECKDFCLWASKKGWHI